jgi:hypothetical protein
MVLVLWRLGVLRGSEESVCNYICLDFDICNLKVKFDEMFHLSNLSRTQVILCLKVL